MLNYTVHSEMQWMEGAEVRSSGQTNIISKWQQPPTTIYDEHVNTDEALWLNVYEDSKIFNSLVCNVRLKMSSQIKKKHKDGQFPPHETPKVFCGLQHFTQSLRSSKPFVSVL